MPTLTINGKSVSAPIGATLIEAGLQNGILIPQDCCSGQCDTCRVDVLNGSVDDAGTREGNSVLACQAKISGDVSIHFDAVPLASTTRGQVVAVRPVCTDIFEVIVQIEKDVPYLPGQYVGVTFANLPERDYSPTLTLDGLREINQLIFHIRKLDDGIVSGEIGRKIVPGCKVKIRGPFGHAFLRRGEGRLVLIASGTGFAPIWSIAVAARLGQPERPVTLVAGVRDPRHLYMRPAFDWLTKHDVTDLHLTASGATPLPPATFGRPTTQMPALTAQDTVFAAGSPEMVNAIKEIAAAAGAKCYADPFLPSSNEIPLGMKFLRFFSSKKSPKKPSTGSIAAE
jgi:NAD(P)H-flavin reductase/ferredoxin